MKTGPRGLALLVGGRLLVAGAVGAAQGPPVDSAGAWHRFWVRPVASLVVPGTGQLMAGQDRGALYIATEIVLLSRYVELSSQGDDAAARYRDLAFDVARRNYAPTRRDTVFEYYEQMQRFAASGEYDRDPGTVFVPEPDPATYNGSVWLLARRTFWADPDSTPDPASTEYQQAVQFYVDRAVGPAFQWSWHDAPLEQQAFSETIRESDGAFREAQTYLGLLIANHLVSAVDAFISSRLAEGLGRPARLETTVGPGGSAVLGLRIGF
ncbi:MAG: hypothetical protein ACREMV_02250 [Gemmatimonadales bacterium]